VATRRRPRRELRMELDSEGAGAVRTCEHLPDGDRKDENVGVVKGASTADELIYERPGRAQRSRRGERAEELSFREGDVRDDRRRFARSRVVRPRA
jgi:hypothetical protein